MPTKLTITQRGTHQVTIAEVNLDRPSPPEVVAEELAAFHHGLRQLVIEGGEHPEARAKRGWDARIYQLSLQLEAINNAVLLAADQNWKLDLE